MKHFLTIAVLSFVIFSVAGSVFAQPVGMPGEDGPAGSPGEDGPVGLSTPIVVKNPIAADSITELFMAIIDILLVFAIPIIAFFIIYAGFMYVTARGNAEQIETAHKALLYALIGGVLILGAKVLIEVIGGTVDEIRGAFLIISSFIA